MSWTAEAYLEPKPRLSVQWHKINPKKGRRYYLAKVLYSFYRKLRLRASECLPDACTNGLFI